MMNEEVLPVYGKTSVTLTGDELFAMKVAIGMEIRTLVDFVERGDPHGVWKNELEQLERAYKKIERALRRT